MDQDRPVVSVIIPAYNCSETILRAINSVLRQTLFDIEVIVVDDGSTDETERVVTEIADSRIELVQHQKNRGRSSARNTGVSVADGEFIAYLDADDVWSPKKLQKQVECLRARSDEWAGVYCGARYIRDGNVKQMLNDAIQRPSGKEGGKELLGDLLTWRLAVHGGSSLLIRSTVVKEIDGWNTDLHRFEDLGYVTQLLHVGKLAYVDEELVRVYESGKSDSDVIEREMDTFFNIYSATIATVEADGYPVTETFRCILLKHQLSDGKLIQERQSFRSSTCPHVRDYFGLGLAVIEGVSSNLRELSRSL